jgi:F-type H+-transporting ATPase subunit epsilon
VTDEIGFEFQVISPTRVVLRERVASVTVPGARGAVGFWVGHAPMLVALSPGVVRYRAAGTALRSVALAVSGGFFEISPDGAATLLAEAAELPEEVDVARAEAALQRARERLRRPTPGIDVARAEVAMQRAIARLRIAAKARH